MVPVQDDDEYRSSGDESPAGITPPQRLSQQQGQAPSMRPSLNNRLIPRDDGAPYENSNPASSTSRNEQTFFRPSLKNRLAPRSDDKPYENGDIPLKKSVSYKGSETDHTSVASFTSNDNSKIGAPVSGSQTKLTTRNELQDVMKENLELMYDIVMQIREDKEYAKSIYRNCPRLQNLLDQHPDLRPLFEDPNLIRLNFEKVYRDAGGVFPEDEAKQNRFQKILKCIVSHPLFKVLKVLLFIKKIITCITSGGMNLLKGCCRSMFWAPETAAGPNDAKSGTPEGEDNSTAGGVSDPNEANKIALYRAADHMEDPKVQANMNELLRSDPDSLDDAIENDPELRALRDSNPLCAELMSDPETMKILTDPDNLRALADAPELIEQDFADPNWTPNELEAPPDAVVDDDDAAVTAINTSGEPDNNNIRAGADEQDDTMYDEDGLALEESGIEDSALEPTEVDLDGTSNDLDAHGDEVTSEEAVALEESGLDESGLDASQNVAEANAQDYDEDNPLEESELAENGMDYTTSEDRNAQAYDEDNVVEESELAENGMDYTTSEDRGAQYIREDIDDANAYEDFQVAETDEQSGSPTFNQPDANDNDGLDEVELAEPDEPINSSDPTTPDVDADTTTATYMGQHGGQKEKEREEGVPRSGTAGAGGIMVGQLVHGMAEIIVSEAIGMGFNEMTGGAGNSDGVSKTLANVADSADYVDEVVEAADETAGAATNTNRDGSRGGDVSAGANQQQQRSTDGSASGDAAPMFSPAASPKKSMGSRFASTLASATKEGVASLFIGEDFSEMLQQRQERKEREAAAAAAAGASSGTGVSTVVEKSTGVSEQGAFSDALGPQKNN